MVSRNGFKRKGYSLASKWGKRNSLHTMKKGHYINASSNTPLLEVKRGRKRGGGINGSKKGKVKVREWWEERGYLTKKGVVKRVRLCAQKVKLARWSRGVGINHGTNKKVRSGEGDLRKHCLPLLTGGRPRPQPKHRVEAGQERMNRGVPLFFSFNKIAAECNR